MKLINKLLNHEILTEAEAEELLIGITNHKFNDSQIVLIITALQTRMVTKEELKGFRRALLQMAVPLNLNFQTAIDVCGTGGDGKNTFNISTITALTIAAAGYKVVKHGNYGVSSFCGSSTILENLGYQFKTDEANLQRQLDETNVCFLHAPLFHPCLKKVASIRQDLKVRTFFNFLGPLVNPVQPDLQLTGVFNPGIARLYQSVLTELRAGFGVVHSMDGYDEISLTAPVKYYSNQDEQLLYPHDLTGVNVSPSDLFGGEDIDTAKDIFNVIISGDGSVEQNEVIKINTAAGIRCFEPQKSMAQACSEAESVLLSGKVKQVLDHCIKISQS